MRRTFAGLTITAFLVALSAPAFAATETVKGQVVDMGCYKADKSNTGVDHKMPEGDTKDCAIALRQGRPAPRAAHRATARCTRSPAAWRPTRTPS